MKLEPKLERGYMRRISSALIIALLFGAVAWAMPPYPGLLDKIQSGAVKAPKHDLTISQAELARAGFGLPRFNPNALARHNATGPFRVLVILVDFSDKPSQAAPVSFDSLVFGQTQSSVRRFYSENSYTQFDLVTVNYPSALGWKRAPQTSTYYANGAYGLGSYPQNAQKLVEDVVDLVDPLVNFADYDNNGDGYVDGLAIVHSGRGAEFSGSTNDIWSHKWAITPRLKDGVYVFNYSMEPEYWVSPGDMTIGVYCHEFGHAIGGLPDLYDTDGGSQGIGRWSLMAGGSWNGSLGSSPSHFDAWCRIQMGFAAAGVLTTNQTGASIPNVEQNNAGIYRLWTNGALGPEYYLVENRQKIGYDAALPSSGLLIWHIDDTVSTGNTRPWYPPNSPSAGHYHVALVQADDSFHLERNRNSGDTGDPYPGSAVNRTFGSTAAPNSNSYASTATPVRVANISNSSSIMSADLYVQTSTGVNDFSNRPAIFELAQNYPNPFNPSTTISYTLSKSGRVELEIFNLLGARVKSFVFADQKAGGHSVQWDGNDNSGRPVSSGLYLYRLKTDNESITKKMTLIR